MDKFDCPQQNKLKMQKLCLFIAIIFMLACNNSTTKIEEEISNLEAQLAQQPSEEILQKLLTLYKDMAARTSDETHLDYLWKAGETARAAKEFDTAESIFMELYAQNDHPDIATKALFLHAFMCDEDLKQYDKAKGLYEQFLQKHPDSDFSDDAEFLLKNLGKSDEEMLEMLNQSAKEQTNQ